jgi:transposase
MAIAGILLVFEQLGASRRRFAMAGQRTYKVTLAEEEREQLRKMLSSGKSAARKLNHARLLLYADESREGLRRTDEEIAALVGLGLRTVARVRQRFVEEGLDAALHPRPRPRGAYKVDTHAAAQILALAQSDPPCGRKRWTLRLLAGQLMVLGREAPSHETVRQVLKKTPSSRGRRRRGAFRRPPMPSS